MLKLLFLILSTLGLTHNTRADRVQTYCDDVVVFVSAKVDPFPCDLAAGQTLVLTDINYALCADAGGRWLPTRTGTCWDVDF